MQVINLNYSVSTIALTNTLANELGFIWFHNGPDTADGMEWFAAWPSQTFVYLGNNQCDITPFSGETTRTNTDYFELLKTQLVEFSDQGDTFFSGGLAGHLNYELGLELLNVPSKFEKTEQPLAQTGLYHWACCIDHQHKKISINIHSDCPAQIVQKVTAFANAASDLNQPLAPVTKSQIDWSCPMDFHSYEKAFAKIQRYIFDGDIYQANLTRQWQATTANSPWQNYHLLTQTMSAPFSFYHATPSATVMSVSPERFIQINGDDILTQPIKGTRPRGRNLAEDDQHKHALVNSEKDKAENLMIVDLLRNDIAKNSTPGSVVVNKLFELQSFKNVHHLVSSIQATKKHDSHPISILKDAFPGGSITGAPKKRAMEVINELELTPRGAYCGSAFFLSFSGYLDSNILIRTITQKDNLLTCSGGGGIVYDSDAKSEFDESDVKVRRLLNALF